MVEREYIITVTNPEVWDEIWDTLTKDGLSDNYIPSRALPVVNERPFNDYCAHFKLTDQEAIELRNDPRLLSVELQADLQPNVEKGLVVSRYGLYDKQDNSINSNMKNWGLLRCTNTTNPFAAALSLTGSYNYSLDGTGVDVVVVDSGIEPNHPELAVNADGTGGSRVIDFNWASLGVPGTASSASIGGYLGDSDGHGTHVATTVAGNTCGWAAGARIYSLRIFSGINITNKTSLGAINSDIAFDIVRAFHLQKISQGNTRPTICTNSWGYRATYSGMVSTTYRGTIHNTSSYNASYGQVYFYFPYVVNYLDISVDNASSAGVIMVGAAGNYRHKIDVPDGQDYNNSWTDGFETYYYHRGSSPTRASSMINVGAVDSSLQEQKASFSESGPRVDVYAPGSAVMAGYANKSYYTSAVMDPRSSVMNTGYTYYLNKLAGTSMATPQVTGMLACILQARPNLTPSEAKEFVIEHSLKNLLQVTGSESYSNQTSLQGGNNRILKTPFTKARRGKMGRGT